MEVYIPVSGPVQYACRAHRGAVRVWRTGTRGPGGALVFYWDDIHYVQFCGTCLVVKSPPASVLLKQAAGIAKGSPVPNKEKIGKVTTQQIREIAQRKMDDLNTDSLERAMKMVEGSARSMGITVEG